jgi:hypothetical protein
MTIPAMPRMTHQTSAFYRDKVDYRSPQLTPGLLTDE